MKLTAYVSKAHQIELNDGEYLLIHSSKTDEPTNMIFKCPSCGGNLLIGDNDNRIINYKTLTVSHPIHHRCGWYGTITNGELNTDHQGRSHLDFFEIGDVDEIVKKLEQWGSK